MTNQNIGTSSEELINARLYRFGEVAWVKETNTARLYVPEVDPTKGPAKDLVGSFLKTGWRKDDQNAFTTGEPIGLDDEVMRPGAEFETTIQELMPDNESVTRRRKISFNTWGDFKTFVLNRRKDEFNRLQNIHARNVADPNATAELEAFKHNFLEADGSFIVPKIWGTTGHQRCICKQYADRLRIMGADAYEKYLKVGEKDAKVPRLDELSNTVPVLVTQFADENARVQFQIRENEGKRDGATPPDPLDRLASARAMLMAGCSQSAIRDAYTATEGVKLYHLVILDARFPGLRIWERLHQNPKEFPVTALVYSKIKSPELPPITRASDKETLLAYNRKQEENAKAGRKSTPEEFMDEAAVGDWFNRTQRGETKAEGENAAKIMDKNEISRLASVNKDYGVKAALEAVLEKRPEVLKRFSNTLESRNALQEIYESHPGVFDLVEDLIRQIRDTQSDKAIKEAVYVAVKALKTSIPAHAEPAPEAVAVPETVEAVAVPETVETPKPKSGKGKKG